MSDWMLTYDGVFFISIATLITSVIGVSIRYCLKSKCEHFSICFGLIKIDRRVDLEVQEELAQLEMGITDGKTEGITENNDKPITQQPTKPKAKRRPSNNDSELENIPISNI